MSIDYTHLTASVVNNYIEGGWGKCHNLPFKKTVPYHLHMYSPALKSGAISPALKSGAILELD